MEDTGIDKLSSFIEKYDFNPFMKGLPDSLQRQFHRRHVAYYHGCSFVIDLGAGKGLFLEELHTSGILGVGVESHIPSVEEGRAKGLKYIANKKNL